MPPLWKTATRLLHDLIGRHPSQGRAEVVFNNIVIIIFLLTVSSITVYTGAMRFFQFVCYDLYSSSAPSISPWVACDYFRSAGRCPGAAAAVTGVGGPRRQGAAVGDIGKVDAAIDKPLAE